MGNIHPKYGLSTLVNHAFEGNNPHFAHVTPIYQTSVFDLPDVATGAAIFQGEESGYLYTRLGNPNLEQLGNKIALLEGIDLLRDQPDRPFKEIVAGKVFGSGMAAVTTAILSKVQPGETIIAQEALYSATINFLNNFAPSHGLQVVWMHDVDPEKWEAAFNAHPEASLAFAESPSNPTMELVDLAGVAEIAHRHNAWLMVDNTFATPYSQRPLTLGADVVIHSTTKFLSGHCLIVGGVVVSTHLDYMNDELYQLLKTLGGSAGPFDAWLTNIGLRTFELRMQRHCENADRVADYLENHPKVARVFFPGLESHPDHDLARRQMLNFGAMLSFELAGGLEAGISLMENIQVCTLGVSLGNVDTLIQHPASMSHSTISPEERQKMGLSDGLVRLSVGIENIEDLLADLEQGLAHCR